MLTDMCCNHLAVLRGGIVENPLNKVIAVLVACNVNQGDPSSVPPAFADSIQVSAKKVCAANLQTLLDNLGCKLIGAILGGITNDVIDGTASIRWGSVLANVLNAPVAKLAMGNNINVGKNLFDARTLSIARQQSPRDSGNKGLRLLVLPCPLRDSSQRCSEQPSCQFLPEQPHATCP